MFEDVEKIVLSGEDFPIKCDILVLEKIQNKSGEIGSFENGISGFTPKIDENGEEVRNDEGLLIGTYGMPNLEMLNDALVWFVTEGMEIEKERGKEYPEITNNALLRKVDWHPKDLGNRLHKEFTRCFVRKNETTA